MKPFILLFLLTPCFAQQSVIVGSLNSTGNVTTVSNEGATGTLLYGLAKYTGAPSTALKTAITDTGGAIGVCVANCGITSTATLQISGDVNCVFDGATTAGDYVVISATTAGNCHDFGAANPYPSETVGVVKSTNGSGGTYIMTLFPPLVDPPQYGTVVDLTAQSAAITATTILATSTSPGAGQYRICYNAKVTTAATTSSTLGPFQIQYTDQNDSVVTQQPGTAVTGVNQNTANSTATGNVGGCYVANAKASTNIQYIMGYTSSGATPMQYNLHLTLQKIR